MEPRMLLVITVLGICFMGCVTYIIARILARWYKHEYEIANRIAVWEHSYDKYPVKYQYVMVCKHCGKIIYKDV